MSEIVSMHFGEQKKVRIRVESISRTPFEIMNAKYELRHGTDVESSGECEIIPLNDYSFLLNALVSPMIKCTIYDLVFKYEIHPEKIIYPCKIRVT